MYMLSEILYKTTNTRLPIYMWNKISESAKLNRLPSDADLHNKKVLTMIACHTDTLTKVKTIINNIIKLSFSNNKIVVVNSSDTIYGGHLKNLMNRLFPAIELFEIPNTSSLDIGKCVFYLDNHYRNTHDYLVFTNDSYYLTAPVYHFYKLMVRSRTQLYGYNDSSQTDKYHYQSYLYGVRSDAVHILVNHYRAMLPLLTGYMEVVYHIELKLCDIFSSKDCVLKIAHLPGHQGRNVFFDNDNLYTLLHKSGVLPIVKLKRGAIPYTAPQPLHKPGGKVECTSLAHYKTSGAKLPSSSANHA